MSSFAALRNLLGVGRNAVSHNQPPRGNVAPARPDGLQTLVVAPRPPRPPSPSGGTCMQLVNMTHTDMSLEKTRRSSGLVSMQSFRQLPRKLG